MYRRILIPLDGSRLSERALPFAAHLSRATGAQLVLVRVVWKPSLLEDDDLGPQARAMQEAEDGLIDLARGLAAQDITADIAVPCDWPAEGILREVERQNADLVVMSTHGRSGLGRWVFGSVADEVMRRIGRPVLLVPAADVSMWPAGRPLRVLVPLDRSDLAVEALGAARELAEALKAEMLLLHIVERPEAGAVEAYPHGDESELETWLIEAYQYLEGLATDLRVGGRTVTVRAVLGAAPAMVARLAREEGADVIAMASHGRGGLSRLVMGSVATATIRWTNVPVLIVRPVALPGTVSESEAAALTPEPAEPRVAVVLSRRDLGLIEHGLEWYLAGPYENRQVRHEVQALLVRLRHVSSPTWTSTRTATRQ